MSQLVLRLSLASKEAGARTQPSRKAEVTMLYDRRNVEDHAATSICWTASRLVLALNHLGTKRHECLGRGSLADKR